MTIVDTKNDVDMYKWYLQLDWNLWFKTYTQLRKSHRFKFKNEADTI